MSEVPLKRVSQEELTVDEDYSAVHILCEALHTCCFSFYIKAGADALGMKFRVCDLKVYLAHKKPHLPRTLQ